MQTSRPDLMDVVRESGRSLTAGVARSRLRGAFVVAQVALALVERVGDGLEINLGLAAAGDAVEEEGAAGIRPAGIAGCLAACCSIGAFHFCRRDAGSTLIHRVDNLPQGC
jgi:hypothetical protein